MQLLRIEGGQRSGETQEQELCVMSRKSVCASKSGQCGEQSREAHELYYLCCVHS